MKLEQYSVMLVAKVAAAMAVAAATAVVMFLQFASFNKIHGMAFKIEEMFVVGID